MVKTLASFRPIRFFPKAAVIEKKMIGAQQRKAEKTRIAIRLAIRKSLEFQALDPIIEQYIFM